MRRYHSQVPHLLLSESKSQGPCEGLRWVEGEQQALHHAVAGRAHLHVSVRVFD